VEVEGSDGTHEAAGVGGEESPQDLQGVTAGHVAHTKLGACHTMGANQGEWASSILLVAQGSCDRRMIQVFLAIFVAQ